MKNTELIAQAKITEMALSNKRIERVNYTETEDGIIVSVRIEWNDYPLISGATYAECLKELIKQVEECNK